MPAEKLTRAEECVQAITQLFLDAARVGTRPASDASYKASLELLEKFVKAELRERSVARAVADNDMDHMREAADILRTMTATADRNSPSYAMPQDIDRLSQWYLRDLQRGTKL